MQQIKYLSSNADARPNHHGCLAIRRRNYFSGLLEVSSSPCETYIAEGRNRWLANQPILMSNMLSEQLENYEVELANSEHLYNAVWQGDDIDELLDKEDYQARLTPKFEMLCSRHDASDEQEIVSVDFDVHENGELIEDIWMRVSWLSFDNNDNSLRFRFSFGMEGYEDVSLDPYRQMLAAELEEKIFPESTIITENKALQQLLGNIVNCNNYRFVERIVYFNAPNGGAQFHHDAEKGHLGVVYAQLTGKTFWLALSKQELVDEIRLFVSIPLNADEFKQQLQFKELDTDFVEKLRDVGFVQQALNDLFHPELGLLLNENILFFQQLVDKGYGYYLQPGDIILLPQENMAACAWHSVFCVGDEAGEALSFAIKAID